MKTSRRESRRATSQWNDDDEESRSREIDRNRSESRSARAEDVNRDREAAQPWRGRQTDSRFGTHGAQGQWETSDQGRRYSAGEDHDDEEENRPYGASRGRAIEYDDDRSGDQGIRGGGIEGVDDHDTYGFGQRGRANRRAWTDDAGRGEGLRLHDAQDFGRGSTGRRSGQRRDRR